MGYDYFLSKQSSLSAGRVNIKIRTTGFATLDVENRGMHMYTYIIRILRYIYWLTACFVVIINS